MKKLLLSVTACLGFIAVNAQIDMFPYSESFEEGDGGWTADALWEVGTPAGATITGASDGDNAWATDLDGNYTTSTLASVVSPVFDFTNAESDPNISMDIWWNSENSWDGTVLQSSTDGGTTWNNVGAFGDADDNWYNDDTINGLDDPQEGWTGRASSGNGSDGYVTATHALDGLAGEATVTLRVVFGSDSSVTDDGFAFDNVVIDGEFLGLGDLSLENTISVFPNPTSNFVNVSNNGNIALKNLTITDINGRTLQNVDLTTAGAQTQISLEKYSTGIYFATINSANGSVVKRIVKQ